MTSPRNGRITVNTWKYYIISTAYILHIPDIVDIINYKPAEVIVRVG